MRTSLRPALIITRREVLDQFRDWRIIFPVIVLTIIFPALMNFTASQAVRFVSRYGAPLVAERLIPFLLMIVGFFPISVSLVIALESFVGEKERRSIEPLLGSPLTDVQLYVGKLLAAMVPPLLAAYLGITVYLIGIYYRVGWRPDPQFLMQILVLTTVQAIVMVAGAVVISSQTTSVRAANLLASFIIIPMALLIQAESVVMFWGQYTILWWIILGLILIAILLVRVGVTHFNREELLGRELDVLNVRWGWSVFKAAFLGQSHSIWQWYAQQIWPTLRRMALPSLFMIFALALAIWAGAKEARVLVLPVEALHMDRLSGGFIQGLDALRFFSPLGIGTIWFHNVRAIVLATILGVFSFGVLGVLVLMLPMMLIGYLMASIASAGFSPALFLAAFILPHGILEIPAMVLAGAAILAMGGTLVTSTPDRTIGEAWLYSLADWAKIMLGVVFPLLVGAAILEALVTPQVAARIIGG